MSTTPTKAPTVGDTVHYVDGAGTIHKASVLDAALQDLPEGRGRGQGIKLQVVPAEGDPFPIVAAYDKGGKVRTWHYPEDT